MPIFSSCYLKNKPGLCQKGNFSSSRGLNQTEIKAVYLFINSTKTTNLQQTTFKATIDNATDKLQH